MKIYISYFYQIRFFTNKFIPVSTAVVDPQWYHDYAGNKIFKDKNNVWNGIRFEKLSMMSNDCHKRCNKNPKTCNFITSYRRYLKSLNFKEIYSSLKNLASFIQSIDKLETEPNIVLIVHEAADNLCSERSSLIDWFKQYNVDIKEWTKEVV